MIPAADRQRGGGDRVAAAGVDSVARGGAAAGGCAVGAAAVPLPPHGSALRVLRGRRGPQAGGPRGGAGGAQATQGGMCRRCSHRWGAMR